MVLIMMVMMMMGGMVLRVNLNLSRILFERRDVVSAGEPIVSCEQGRNLRTCSFFLACACLVKNSKWYVYTILTFF